MSVCLVIQRKNEIILASDRAICVPKENGINERVIGEYEKIWHTPQGQIIFCAGSKDFSEGLKEYTKDWRNEVTIEDIEIYSREHHNKNQIDLNAIIIAEIIDGETIITELYSSSDFKPQVTRGMTDGREYLISAIGWKHHELEEKVYGELYLDFNTKEDGAKTNIGKIIKKAFNDIVCPEVGVSVDIFKLYRDSKIEEWYKENNRKIPIHYSQCTNVNIPLNDDFKPMVINVIAKEQQLFLGIEEDEYGMRKATFRLVGKDGSVVITEDGIVLKDQVIYEDNVSKGFPMRIPYRIDEGVHKVKKAILTLYLDKYRAYERSAKSSGQITSSTIPTTTSGASSKSSSTSEAGGGFTISKASESTAEDLYGAMTENATNMGIGDSLLTAIDSRNAPQINRLISNHVHPMSHWQESHSHMVNIQQESHHHEVDLQHTHQIEGHNHTIEGHTHSLEYGIFIQDSMPTDIEVYVNGTLARNGINAHCEVDITNYLKTGMANDIKIYSQTNGRISANVWASMFNFW
jgi:hypothetical protein